MSFSPRLVRFYPAAILLGCLVVAYGPSYPESGEQDHWKAPAMLDAPIAESAQAKVLLRRQPGFFVPNLGQWDHAASFVHRSGPMNLFLQDRGWVVDLVERPVDDAEAHLKSGVRQLAPGDRKVEQKIRGASLRMTFEGEYLPEIVGENEFPGRHNYFLGDDESRWRTDVPLYGSVRYENLYPGIDLRLREASGVPEYDVLLQPGADLSSVAVHVEGAERLTIASDGALVMQTVLGPVTQTVPKTWQVGRDGRKREVACSFVLLGADRFGFTAAGWDSETRLVIDPGLIYSTFLGGKGVDELKAVSVDASGLVTLAGKTFSTDFPTTIGAYSTTLSGTIDAVVTCLDPNKTGSAQLVYSTFLGGPGDEDGLALSVDSSGVVTVAGSTTKTGFPSTPGAYDTTYNGGASSTEDCFMSRLDPSKTGTAQLVYSTYLGGANRDAATDLSVDSNGVATLFGVTDSTNFPTTSGGYDTSFNGGTFDFFVSRLDPSKVGTAQLVYSTFLGGISGEFIGAFFVDGSGVVTIVGITISADYPTTSGAFDRSHNGVWRKAIVSRLDPGKTGSAQLVYSTFLGRAFARDLFVDSSGVVTVAGETAISGFPTTSGAYDTTFNTSGKFDAFVSRLDPSKVGSAQLVYSTFLGGNRTESFSGLCVDARGVVTMVGETSSSDYPTTIGAYDTSHNGGFFDGFVSRLDPGRRGSAQLVYSTFLGGTKEDFCRHLSVDASGVATVVGSTASTDFPTTGGAYDRSHGGPVGASLGDAYVSRLDMGVVLRADVHQLSRKQAGSQELTLNAGKQHAGRLYWVFGSTAGTTPGVNLLGVHIPLNPDGYTDVAIALVNGTVFTNFQGTLGADGMATASLNVPANLPHPPGFTAHHAYVVYDASGRIYMASNSVPLRLTK